MEVREVTGKQDLYIIKGHLSGQKFPLEETQ
jgi:hypothetical protein